MSDWVSTIANIWTMVQTINKNVTSILNMETKAMAAIDDLNAAVTTLAGNFTTLDTAIQAEIAALTAALAAGNTAAVETAATNIGAVSAQMATDAAALTASLAPAAPTT